MGRRFVVPVGLAVLVVIAASSSPARAQYDPLAGAVVRVRAPAEYVQQWLPGSSSSYVRRNGASVAERRGTLMLRGGQAAIDVRRPITGRGLWVAGRTIARTFGPGALVAAGLWTLAELTTRGQAPLVHESGVWLYGVEYGLGNRWLFCSSWQRGDWAAMMSNCQAYYSTGGYQWLRWEWVVRGSSVRHFFRFPSGSEGSTTVGCDSGCGVGYDYQTATDAQIESAIESRATGNEARLEGLTREAGPYVLPEHWGATELTGPSSVSGGTRERITPEGRVVETITYQLSYAGDTVTINVQTVANTYNTSGQLVRTETTTETGGDARTEQEQERREYDTPPADTIERREVPITWAPVPISWVAACPAPRVVGTPWGQVTFSYEWPCMFAEAVRPVVLAIAGIVALLIFAGGRRHG